MSDKLTKEESAQIEEERSLYWRSIAEKLERENAALRSDLNKCNNLSEIRRDAFYDEKSERWKMVYRVRELERKNIALRAENHLLRMKSGINVGQMYGVADADAARKEAQP